MDSKEFIRQLSAGNASEAKQTLDNLLSQVAFESLDAKKQEIAHSLFGEPVVEEGVVNEESLTAGKRLISKHGDGVHTAKVYHDKDYNEYQAHFYKHGKHMGEGPVYYTDDKKEAQDNAENGCKQLDSKQ